jgi:hypothetical protein
LLPAVIFIVFANSAVGANRYIFPHCYRYFVGQSYHEHPELGRFLWSELMAEVCRATVGQTAYVHNDQYVIKCGKTGMSFAWHQVGSTPSC